MKRILCIVGSMNAGGAETFLMKLYRNLDRTQYQMDFCVAIKEPGIYDDEIRSLGGKIFYTIPKSKGILKSFNAIRNIVSKNQYSYVMRVSQHSLSGLELLAAKMGGAKTTVFRSSNTQTGGGTLNRILHKICLPITMYVPDVKIAPSTEAADFMFGKNSVKKRDAVILPNALDLKVFAFNQEIRNTVRAELGIEDRFVVGHIGRFSQQKNHEFLIEIFLEIKKLRRNAFLLLIGKGELMDKVQKQVDEKGLGDSVKFLGVRKDVSSLLSAMDIFIFPSFFEGMPNTVIEAQTSGLPCLVADTITKEAEVTKLVRFMGLYDKADVWAGAAIKMGEANISRENVEKEMALKGYEIKECTQRFVELVFKQEK